MDNAKTHTGAQAIDWEAAKQDPDVIAAFVGENDFYYLQVFTFQEPPRWNWASFFLKDIWYLYRKMWREQCLLWAALLGLEFAGTLLVSLLLALSKTQQEALHIVNIYLRPSKLLDFGIDIFQMFFYGFLGNTLYRRRFHKTLDKLRTDGVRNRGQLLHRLRQECGVSYGLPIVGELGVLAVAVGMGWLSSQIIAAALQHLV